MNLIRDVASDRIQKKNGAIINWQKNCIPCHTSPSLVNENMITNWESCFTWPFVLYRFHCEWSLPSPYYDVVFGGCGCCCCCSNVKSSSSTVNSQTVCLCQQFLISTSTFFSSSSASASLFTVYSLFLALFILVCKIKRFGIVRYYLQAHAKSEKIPHKTENYLVESKCTFIRSCVCVWVCVSTPATFLLITSISSFLFLTLFLEIKTFRLRSRKSRRRKKRNVRIINKKKMALYRA